MRKIVFYVLLIALLYSTAIPSMEARPPVPADLQNKINAAVDSGVEWLKKKQEPEGFWETADNPTYADGDADPNVYRFGITALSLLALLESDVPTDDEVIKKGFHYLHEHLTDGKFTYPYATYIMAAHSLARHRLEESVADLPKDKRLKKIAKTPIIKFTDRSMHKTLKIAHSTILQHQFNEGGWRYGRIDEGQNGLNNNTPDGDKGDTSSTQFALLGLHYGSELGLKTKTDVYSKAAMWLLEHQDKDGPKVERIEGEQVEQDDGDSYIPNITKDRSRGWPYIRGAQREAEGNVCGGMTTVGISGLIIAKAHLLRTGWYRKNRDIYNQAIFDGFAWLSQNWSVTTNPGGHRSMYYYLYGLERVGVMGGFDYIAGHHWFKEGAEVLVKAQEADGHWIAKGEVNPQDTIGTGLALLFLKRGTAPVYSGQPER